MDKVGFIGIGEIGTPIALRLLQAGHPMVVYDNRPHQVISLESYAPEIADTPKHLAERCNVIFLALPTSKEVREVALSDDGIAHGAAPDTTIVDMTSGNPKDTISIAMRLKRKSIHMIDAGVSGSVTAAETGSLSIMAGGCIDIYEKIIPLLKHIATNIFHVGPVGAGHSIKALNNFVFATTYAALSEALVVGVKAGLDPGIVTKVFNASSSRSWASQDRIPQFLLKRDFGHRGGMAMDLMAKDLATACEMGLKHDVPMPLANAVHELLEQCVSYMGGKVSNTAITKLYEKWANTQITENTLQP